MACANAAAVLVTLGAKARRAAGVKAEACPTMKEANRALREKFIVLSSELFGIL